jgi:DNA-binding NarL/FixJ family response regulator
MIAQGSGLAEDPGVEAPPSVWIVEDNAAYRASVVRVLSTIARPNSVRAFGDCEDALAAFKTETAPEIMLLDLGLPGMNGLEGLAQFKVLAPNIRIVIVTSFDDHDRIFKAICAGASGYLLKSAPFAAITQAVQEVRRGGAPMSPQVASAVLNMFTNLASAKPPSPDYGLTPREKETLTGMVQGLTMKAIAAQMSVSYHTVDTYVRNIYTKLHVGSRSSAVAKSLRERLF